MQNPKKYLLIAVAEGVKWHDDKTGKPEYVYASSEVDEYGHPRFGGISGIVASDITKKLQIEARAQITGYYPRAGYCRQYDRKLTSTLADKVIDLLLREDYGKMPVINKIVPFPELEEFNTSAIDMGNIGNKPLPEEYYDLNKFAFNNTYNDFLRNIVGERVFPDFKYDFPIVVPED